MCGIAGFVTLVPHAYPDTILARMTRTLAHRGPDDAGTYRDAHAALGHRRLSIIDLATGHQPMSSESGDLWIVYNGEIFNHAALRHQELEPRGHIYRTRSDTETILHAYEEFGESSPQFFRGMFAYAIWDRRQRKLFCVRDRLGIKPFYYCWNGREFIFASEIKALLAHPSVSAAVEDSLLAEHLAFGYSSGEKTLYKGIRRLMPGHTLTLETQGSRAGALRIERYWDIPEPGAAEARSEQDWVQECRQRLEESVRMRLMSDVPLGMFLSGGVDSSLIAALMKRSVSGPVQTFAVGYKETAFSELSYARQASHAIGTEHYEVTVGMEEFFNVLPKLIWHEDEPLTWPSSVSLYFVAKLASQHVKVVLTGEGADELFAGYGRYRFYLMNRRLLGLWKLLPASWRKKLRDQIADAPWIPAALRRKLHHTFVGSGEDLESLYLDNFYAAFPAAERAALGQPGDAFADFRLYWEAASGRPRLEQMLYADQKTYLVELLMKQDQMSMAASIESRVPFLDHTFVEFAARVPAQWKLRGRAGKYVIKKVAAEWMPRPIIARRKMGFPTPLRAWLHDPRLQPVLDAMLAREGFLASVVDARAAENTLQRHRSRQLDATDRLWRLLNLHLWGEMQIAGRRSPEDALLAVPAAL